jgi:hypothetical protein
MRQQRRTVPFTKWLSVLCTHCRKNMQISALTYIPGHAHYCTDCRNMMKEPDNDQE